MIQLSAKKLLWRSLNCTTFLIFLLLLEAILCMSPMIQQTLILIQWGGDVVSTMIYLFFNSRSETKCRFRRQPIIIPIASLSYTQSIQHLHHLSGHNGLPRASNYESVHHLCLALQHNSPAGPCRPCTTRPLAQMVRWLEILFLSIRSGLWWILDLALAKRQILN